MEGLNNMKEPNTAPQAGRWYNLTLGSSFTDHQPSSRFCTLRYDFKPASIDKNQPGTLHKNKDNKVTVEFQNNQPGRPNVTFEGISEDHKENDAVLLFDGECMRLERLHQHVKRLKYNRTHGESTVTTAPGISDASSPPVMKGMKHHSLNKETFHAAPVEVERIDVGGFKSSGADVKHRHEKPTGYPANSPNISPDLVDIMNEDDDEGKSINVKEYETGNVEVREYETGNVEVKEYDTGIDINIPHQSYSDDETADVDVLDDEADNGPTAAQALIAQAAKKQSDSSSSSGSVSSSSSSSSESSGSGSSSGGDSSDGDTVNSI